MENWIWLAPLLFLLGSLFGVVVLWRHAEHRLLELRRKIYTLEDALKQKASDLDKGADQMQRDALAMEAASAKIDEVKRDQEVANDRASRAERRCLDYFALLERLEKQRDEWKDMWFTQLGQHQEAQSMLESALLQTRQFLARAISELNVLRKEKSLPPIQKLLDLQAPPLGTAKAYAERMKRLEEAAPKNVDVSGEVAKIDPP